MASLLRRFASNSSQSERRSSCHEDANGRVLDPLEPIARSPLNAPRLNLAKYVAINNAMNSQRPLAPILDGGSDDAKLKPGENNHGLNNGHVRSKTGAAPFIKARLPGTSGADGPRSCSAKETPLRPVFEDRKSSFLQNMFVRRKSCTASIHVPPTSNGGCFRRVSLTEAQMNESPQLTRLLGAGGFGTVYMGEIDKRRVAVKRFHGRTKNEKAKAESFKAETIAKTLRHPNIVRVYGTASKENTNCVIMEYVGDTNLQQIINNIDDPLDIIRKISYIQDVISALTFIHANNFVHLDVKPANILITSYDTCKLGDFGCCQIIENGTGRVSPTQRSYLTGTFAYRAPELLRGEAPSTSADIYSFGITLWQLAHRQQPYAGQNQHVVVFGVVAYGLRPDAAPAILGRRAMDVGESQPKIVTDRDDIDSESQAETVTNSDGANGESCVDISDNSDSKTKNTPSSPECVFADMYERCWQANPGDRPTAQDLSEEVNVLKQRLIRSS